MKIAKLQEEGVLILELTGRLDTLSCSGLEKEIDSLDTAMISKLIIDLKGVDYVSSAGLRALLIGLKKFSGNDQKFFLCGLSDSIQEVFNIVGFSSVYVIHNDRAEALNAMRT